MPVDVPTHHPFSCHISDLMERYEYMQYKSSTWRRICTSGIGVRILAVSEGRPQMQNKTFTAREDVSGQPQIPSASAQLTQSY